MVAFNRKTEGAKQVSTHLSPRGNRTNSGQVHSSWVGVSAPQNAPTSLSATPADTSVGIAFTPPTDNGGMDINNYQYAISSNGGSTYSAYAALSPADGVSPITVTGLTQNTAYLIKLKAVNDVGVSDVESSPVSFTSQGVPTSAPSSLSSTQTNTTATISFTAAASSTSITNYEYSLNNSTWTALSPADAVSPVIISGLSENTAYNVYLRGVNSYGSGPGSTATSFTTFGPPTGTATISSISSVTQTTATVNFSVAAGGSAITGYDLYVANLTNVWNDTTASPISVTGLTANTAYTFYVRAKNAYGVGPQSAGFDATTNKVAPSSVEYLVVAGGGGGGVWAGGGGGGAGGYRSGTASIASATVYTVTVGGGGSSGSNGATPVAGSSSSALGIASNGGGRGGGDSGGSTGAGSATTGGSGGGGGRNGQGGAAGTAGQGGNGGTASGMNAGGGGGAGANGGNGTGGAGFGGNGGTGSSSSITGTATTRAGGGGGGAHESSATGGTGGAGGGGNANSACNNANPGTTNTGGGGGGASGITLSCGVLGGAGGSGVVIIAYPTSFTAAVATTGSPEYSTVSRSGYHVYTFNGSGSITF